jgi:hypothetical protein
MLSLLSAVAFAFATPAASDASTLGRDLDPVGRNGS